MSFSNNQSYGPLSLGKWFVQSTGEGGVSQAKESAWIKILLSECNEKVIHEPLHSKCRWTCGQCYLETSKTTWMKYSLVLEKGTGKGGGGYICKLWEHCVKSFPPSGHIFLCILILLFEILWFIVLEKSVCFSWMCILQISSWIFHPFRV